MFGSGSPYTANELMHLIVRHSPKRVDVGMLSGSLNRGIGGSTEIAGKMRPLPRLDRREGALEPVILVLSL
jgi:hypothetical protein